MHPLTRNQFLVLTVLLRHPMHAYLIRQEITQLTSHRVWLSHSSVKNVLNKLLELGYIEECHSNPYYWLKVKRGTPYEISQQGYHFIRRELSMYYEVFVKSRGWLEKSDI